MVERTLVRPPRSSMGPITATMRRQLMAGSLVAGVYDTPIDRESAYEILSAKAEQLAQEQQAAEVAKMQEEALARAQRRPAGRQRQTVSESFFKSAARAVGSQVGRQLIRGVLGSLFGGRR